ncbi:hypothetical protein ACLOJK_021454 [Asimina triloba]
MEEPISWSVGRDRIQSVTNKLHGHIEVLPKRHSVMSNVPRAFVTSMPSKLQRVGTPGLKAFLASLEGFINDAASDIRENCSCTTWAILRFTDCLPQTYTDVNYRTISFLVSCCGWWFLPVW